MITERQLYMIANNPDTIMEADILLKRRLLKNVKLSKDRYLAEVESFPVEITFENGRIHYFSCGCGKAVYPNRACRHVIALIKKANQAIENCKKENLRMESITEGIFNSFTEDAFTKDIIKQPLTLIKTLEINKEHHIARLSFKIGLTKFYVVKDILELLDAFKKDKEIEYSDNFTLIPDYHGLSPKDEKLLNLLYEIYQLAPTCFYERYVELTDIFLDKILLILNNEKINLKYDNEVFEDLSITKDAVENPMKIMYDGKSIVLDLTPFKNMKVLTNNYEYIEYNDCIYHLSKRQTYQLKPFLIASQNDINNIRFSNSKKDKFISEIIPNLPRCIELPELLENEILRYPLKAKLYLDKVKNAIVAKPEFQYGFYKFNPLQTNECIMIDDKYLIRQTKKEERLMNIFYNANFKVRQGNLLIEDQNDILDFVNVFLPLIQENMDVFYTDSFKTIIKHRAISFRLNFNDETNLFDVSFKYDNILKTDFKNIIKGYRLKQKYYRLSDGSFISLDDEDTKKLIEAADYMDINPDQLLKGKMSLNTYQALMLSNHVEVHSDDVKFKELVNNVKNKESLEFDQIPEMTVKHRDYQIAGYKWFKTLNYYQFGGVLADDMGLGKTLQTLTFILDECRHSTLPNLVVCPSSLIYNWEEEIKKFTPTLKYMIVVGNQATRRELIKSVKDYQLIVTSYPLMRNDYMHYAEYQFNHFIIDEAQNIKNSNSLNAKSVKQIKAHTRFALTGTPIENSLTELWSIFDFIMPGMLLTKHKFRENYEKPIIMDRNKNIEKLLYQRISPFILRRMKKDVLTELPEKIESKYVIELTDKQKMLYIDLLAKTRHELQETFAKHGYEKSQIKALEALMRLRQICNHPSMFIENYTGGSGKMEALREIINEAVLSKRKVLIFSQFVSMLSLIKEQLQLAEIPYYYLDGNTPSLERMNLVNEFNSNDVPIFLISLKAGGTGLNLTSASMVIHVDPWWNPAVEQQATDRAYRLGQTQNVQVIKLIAKGTIEEKIYELQQSKLSLIDSIIKPGETFINKLTEEEMMNLLI